MKTDSKEIPGFDSYVFILNFFFCFLTSVFMYSILTPDFLIYV